MANRKDNKGRVLKTGESQRKDGTYEYKYTDAEGKRRSVYSKRLTPSDKYIDGKIDLSLREKIAEIQKDLSDGIIPRANNKKTFQECYEEYLETKQNLKMRTLLNYKKIYRLCIQKNMGSRYISDIKYGDIVNMYLKLINVYDYSLGTIGIVQRLVHSVFELAVRNDYIRKNPSDKALSAIKSNTEVEDTKRHALTKTEQRNFMKYAQMSGCYYRYYNLYTFLLGTGCRIGEALGLRWEDCDFNNNTISINHILGYYEGEDGKYEYHITSPKTSAGNRTIPMMRAVREALLVEFRDSVDKNTSKYIIDGYSGFVFTKKNGSPYSPRLIESSMKNLCNRYNKLESISSQREGREPELLPEITPHILRHTFCTRYCEIETNLKVIQEIMGHSDITTTMQIYNEATNDAKNESFKNLDIQLNIFNP